MSEVRIAELERAVALARAVAVPLAEVLSRSAGATIIVESPQAERASASEIASGLSGTYWVVPVEIGGVHNGVMCVLVPRGLAPDAAAFASAADEFLSRSGDRLTAAEGGAVSLDRLGLREATAESAAGVLGESLGPLECVAVRFAARRASDALSTARGELAVVFGGRLVRELAATSSGGSGAGETIVRTRAAEPRGGPTTSATGNSEGAKEEARDSRPPSAVSAPKVMPQELLERAKGLSLRLSVELGRRTLPLGELVRLGPGSSIDIGRSVTDPLDLRAGGRLVALVDAVVVGGRGGVRVRAVVPPSR